MADKKKRVTRYTVRAPVFGPFKEGDVVTTEELAEAGIDAELQQRIGLLDLVSGEPAEPTDRLPDTAATPPPAEE